MPARRVAYCTSFFFGCRRPNRKPIQMEGSKLLRQNNFSPRSQEDVFSTQSSSWFRHRHVGVEIIRLDTKIAHGLTYSFHSSGSKSFRQSPQPRTVVPNRRFRRKSIFAHTNYSIFVTLQKAVFVVDLVEPSHDAEERARCCQRRTSKTQRLSPKPFVLSLELRNTLMRNSLKERGSLRLHLSTARVEKFSA